MKNSKLQLGSILSVPKWFQQLRNEQKMYAKFGLMILTSMLLMYGVMYLNTYQLSHVSWSETRFFMTLLMGATMSIVMLVFMLGMYKNRKFNVGIISAAFVILGLSTFLVRSQNTVDDVAYMSGMIPHHSIAILTSENSDLQDKRVCELATEIIKAQRREIDEMQWLIEDIKLNGPARTTEEAEQRKVPKFDGTSIRDCVL